MASPNEIIRKLLETWPTLYKNRAEAMSAMFSGSNYYWENGELHPVRGTFEKFSNDKGPFREMEKHSVDLPEHIAFDRINVKLENAKIQFVLDNLDDLTLSFHGKLDHVSFHHYTLEDIPEDINDEWKAAILEHCERALEDHRMGEMARWEHRYGSLEKPIQECRAAIEKVTGKTMEQINEDRAIIAKRIISEILTEDKANDDAV